MNATSTSTILPTVDAVIEAHARLRHARPLVQCLTNRVSANFMANVLLAAGAAPAMVDNPEEAAGFAAVAGAVLVNLGTPTSAQVESMRLAARAAQDAGKPWVLDPVGAGGLPWRGGVAAELLAFGPSVVRGNASEIIALAGLGGGTRGVDSSADPAAAVGAAADLLRHAGAVGASGAIDHIVGRAAGTPASEVVLVRVGGGSALLPRVTATGCSLGALVAAYMAAVGDPLLAAVAAHVHFAVAAELAEPRASGPGSFVPAFLDALDALDASAIRDRAHVDSSPLRIG